MSDAAPREVRVSWREKESAPLFCRQKTRVCNFSAEARNDKAAEQKGDGDGQGRP